MSQIYRKYKETHDILKDKKRKKARWQKIKLCAEYDIEHVYKDISQVDEKLVNSRGWGGDGRVTSLFFFLTKNYALF